MFNTSDKGRLIAKILNDEKTDKRKETIKISIAEDDEESDEETQFKKREKTFNAINLKKGKFQYMTDKGRDRETIYCCGSAGSGKSYWIKLYLENCYMKQFKNNQIYLFSECEDDPAFSNIKMNRFKIKDDKFLDDPLDFRDFENCLCIFDDIDAIKGKLGKFLYDLRDKLLKNSRKYGVSVITTNHSPTGLDQKAVLNESNVIVFFMHNFNRSLKYLLQNYIGMDKLGIENLRKLKKSRWTAYIKCFPNVIMDEYNLYKLNDLNEKKLENIKTN